MEDGRDPFDKRSSTDILMNALEEFGKSEAKSVMVIWTDEAGDVCICSNATRTQGLGFCAYVKESIIREMFSE